MSIRQYLKGYVPPADCSDEELAEACLAEARRMNILYHNGYREAQTLLRMAGERLRVASTRTEEAQ